MEEILCEPLCSLYLCVENILLFISETVYPFQEYRKQLSRIGR